MHGQLEQIVEEFLAARARLHNLAEVSPAELWAYRPHPERWSAAQCIDHLNRTGEIYLEIIRKSLEQGQEMARKSARPAPRRYRRDPVGWLLSAVMLPPVRLSRAKTVPLLAPAPGPALPLEELVGRFDELQAKHIDLVRSAEGLPLGRLRIESPIDPRVSYNLFSCFTILPRHQHRHVWQAEKAIVDVAHAAVRSAA